MKIIIRTTYYIYVPAKPFSIKLNDVSFTWSTSMAKRATDLPFVVSGGRVEFELGRLGDYEVIATDFETP